MASLPASDELFASPPVYFLPDEGQAGADVKVYHVNPAFIPTPLPAPTVYFSPEVACSTQPSGTDPEPKPPRPRKQRFVSYNPKLYRAPLLMTCSSCHTQAFTKVSFSAGRYAWLMCLVFVIFGLVLGCCLIPFFMKSFKDAYHRCPHCGWVLLIHRTSCCG